MEDQTNKNGSKVKLNLLIIGPTREGGRGDFQLEYLV